MNKNLILFNSRHPAKFVFLSNTCKYKKDLFSNENFSPYTKHFFLARNQLNLWMALKSTIPFALINNIVKKQCLQQKELERMTSRPFSRPVLKYLFNVVFTNTYRIPRKKLAQPINRTSPWKNTSILFAFFVSDFSFNFK